LIPSSRPQQNKDRLSKEPNKAHKSTLKEEIPQEIMENFMKMLLDKVNQNVQEALKKFQNNKHKGYEKTQKQISELIGALNKYQSETENTINREISELRRKTDNIKEEVTHNIENLRAKMKQKYKTQWKATTAD
jgi:polyhydroxyalkanoate synthesis regulator phasin